MRIPKIFLSSKSDNFKSFKPYFESINWLVKVFYSSSFFGEFLFLILSHTEISTDFYPWVPAVHFAPHPRAIATPQKLVLVGGLPKKLDFISPSLWTAPNFITERSKYECKHGHSRVHIWVQTWPWNGPNRSAKFFMEGSKYECKLFW